MSETTATPQASAPAAPSAPTTSDASLAQNIAAASQNSKETSAEPSEASEAVVSPKEDPKPKVNVDELVKGSYRKLEEAAKMRKEAVAKAEEAQNILHRLENDPSFLDERPDLAAKLEDYYINKLAREEYLNELGKRDPREKELVEREEQLHRQEEQAAKARQAREVEAANAQAVAYAERLESEMVQALTNSGLRKTPRTIRLFAERMADALEVGYEASHEELIEEVRAEYEHWKGDVVAEWDGTPDEELLEKIGLERARRISRAYVGRLKNTKQQGHQTHRGADAVEILKQKPNLMPSDLAGLSDAERFRILHAK